MGTNYYWYEKPPCPCCQRPFEEKHIGKSSGGWCFALHVYPEDGINNLDDWKALWVRDESWIQSEYGHKILPADMEIIIRNRLWPSTSEDRLTPKWYRDNHAVRGPGGLVRHRIDGIHCIGHGDGAWDLIIGEFS